MPRYADVPYEHLDPQQRQVHDRIAAGPRGDVAGPFAALLRSPLLCDRVQQVGQFIRFESRLPGRVRELAILLTARHWRAQYEWYAHCQLARAEGLDGAIIQAVRDGVDLPLDDPALQATREFVSLLLSSGHVPDDVHDRVTALLDERGVVELVATVGYYCLVSLVLNTAEVPVPAGNELLPDR